RRRVSERRTGRGRGTIGKVNNVLDGEWHAIERQRVAGGTPPQSGFHLSHERLVGKSVSPDGRIRILCETVNQARDDSARLAFPRLIEARKRSKVEAGDKRRRGHHCNLGQGERQAQPTSVSKQADSRTPRFPGQRGQPPTGGRKRTTRFD